MPTGFRISSLVPCGLTVESVRRADETIVVTARAEARIADCPLCGASSRRVHSRYIRQVSDLPCSGQKIHLRVVARRFVCSAPHCRRRIFAERFGDAVLAVRSRRTTRLECIVHHLGLALGGRPAASFARRLMLPVSNDTLLRVVRRRASLPEGQLKVIGIDDWAWRRNHRYGTIVCDLERRRIVTLLPDCHCRGVARRSSGDHHRLTRPRRWLSRGDRKSVATRDPGRRPLASHGECECGLPRCRAQVHALDPNCDRRHDHQSRSAHLRGEAAVPMIPAA